MSDTPIGFDPDMPLTGSTKQEESSESNSAVAELVARFKTIFVAYPLHTAFHS